MSALSREAIQEIARLATIDDRLKITTPKGGWAIVVPDGYKVHDFPPLDPVLSHVKQGVVLHDAASFIAYVNAFKGGGTRIFAEPGFASPEKTARFRAVFDYHWPGAVQPADAAADGVVTDVGASVAAYGAHYAVYAPRYSEAWDRWNKDCNRPLEQAEFAELLEECRKDIVAPAAASLLDVVTTFKATKKVEFDSVTYQRDSSVKLHFSDVVEKGGSSALLPEQLQLGIPVYYRGTPIAVDVWIRFKVGSGGVKFTLKIDRPDRIEDFAFEGLAAEVQTATGVPLHIGRLG
jgi:uncharacterized protein YfdQ (DUF2303 family)